MKKKTLTLLAFALIAGAAQSAQVLYPADEHQGFVGPTNLFTGDVAVEMLFPSNDTAHYSGAYVTFQPGARTAWHWHPAGQHMIVTDGTALTGTRDGKILEFHEGESVWCPPDLDHWHGATPDAPMTHLVITGSRDGQNVIWKELVTDEQYLGKRSEEMNDIDALSKRQQAIIPIAAFTAGGDLDKLKTALIDGLDAGLTVNEIKEIPVHLYAYAGFPRTLNALTTFRTLLEERKADGIVDEEGEEASPVTADLNKNEYGAQVRAKLSGLEQDMSGTPWQLFSPISDTFLKEHLFADLFARDVISHQDRELITISALANMTGTEGQLAYHLGGAMNTGFTKEQMTDFIRVFKTAVGPVPAVRAEKVLSAVLESK